MRRRRYSALAASLAVLLSGCSAHSRAASVLPATAAGPQETVVSIGGSATEGDGLRNRLQEAWPYLVFRNALPISTVFVNAALDDATATHALTLQVPVATELKPDLVEVWLGADDVAAATPIPTFTTALTELVTRLRVSTETRVLVADLPASFGTRAAPYNTAIRSVVVTTGAELVSLANASVTLAPEKGFAAQPDAAGHRALAAAFEKVITKSN